MDNYVIRLMKKYKDDLEYVIEHTKDYIDDEKIDFKQIKRFMEDTYANSPITADYVYPTFMQLIVEECYDINSIINNSKLTRNAFEGVKFKNKTIDINKKSLTNYAFNNTIFEDCVININCEVLHTGCFESCHIKNCTINIVDGCTTIFKNALAVLGANSKIVLPKSLEILDSRQMKSNASIIVEYKGTSDEFMDLFIDTEQISFPEVRCSDGVTIHRK